MSTQPATPAPLSPVSDTLVDRERRNPFLRWMMHLGVPGLVSIAIHMVFIALLALRTFTIMKQPEIDVGDVNASITESLADKMSKAFQWDKQQELETPKDKVDLETPDIRDLTKDLDAEDLTPNTGNPDEGLGQGEGRFSLLGTGTGAGEAGSGGFGTGMGGGGGRLGQVGMWDFKIDANKVVYVIDYSGSIIVAVDDLKRELKRSIGRMKDFQAFDVVLYYGDPNQQRTFSDAFEGSLQNANEASKRKFTAWIDKKAPQGGTNPLPAIQRAISEKPEAILFFSDGLVDEEDVVRIASANNKRCRIHCLVFDELLLSDTSGLPKETDGAKRMRKIAEQNGGKCKIVTGADVRGGR